MNIFVTSKCPVQSATNLCDIHVNKMLQEVVQLLSVAHFELDGVVKGTKPSHNNHPCALYVRRCKANYLWTLAHAKALMDEYTFRKGKVHGYKKYFDQVQALPENIPESGDEDFPMCMPDNCKKTFDVHTNYKYYLNQKHKEWLTRTDKKPIVAKWSNRVKPEWVE